MVHNNLWRITHLAEATAESQATSKYYYLFLYFIQYHDFEYSANPVTAKQLIVVKSFPVCDAFLILAKCKPRIKGNPHNSWNICNSKIMPSQNRFYCLTLGGNPECTCCSFNLLWKCKTFASIDPSVLHGSSMWSSALCVLEKNTGLSLLTHSAQLSRTRFCSSKISYE